MKVMLKKILTKLLQFITPSVINATRVGDFWQSGNIVVARRGGTVTVMFAGTNFRAYTGRQTIATIPTGYRPRNEVYGFCTNGEVFIFQANGDIQRDGTAGVSIVYGTGTYTWTN